MGLVAVPMRIFIAGTFAAVTLVATNDGLWLRTANPRPSRNAADFPDLTEKRAHLRGSTDARITLEEFADFECGPCGRLFPVIKQVERYSDQPMRVVFRHHPVSTHPHAMAAAPAAEAAGLQHRFWEMHDLLYQRQADWGSVPDCRPVFDKYAKELGLDVVRFERDCESAEVRARIEADQKRGAEQGVRATPTLFINEWLVPRDSYSVDGLRRRINMMAASIPANWPKPSAPPNSEDHHVEAQH